MQGEILRGSETDLRILSDVQWFWVLVIHTFGEATRRDILHTPNNTGREVTNERPLSFQDNKEMCTVGYDLFDEPK